MTPPELGGVAGHYDHPELMPTVERGLLLSGADPLRRVVEALYRRPG